MRKGGMVVIMALTTVLAACGGEPGASATEGVTPGTGAEVQVGLSEFTIDMTSSLSAGPTTFTITNNGTVEHSFEVEGGGMEEALESNLAPGESTTLEVDLAAGTYEVYCPVDGHRDQGMEVELTVGQ